MLRHGEAGENKFLLRGDSDEGVKDRHKLKSEIYLS